MEKPSNSDVAIAITATIAVSIVTVVATEVAWHVGIKLLCKKLNK